MSESGNAKPSYEILRRARSKYAIPSNFPIDLDEASDTYYPTEHARIEYLHDENMVISGAKVHSVGSLTKGSLFHEIGHLKLRFMNIPVYNVFHDTPSWISYLLVIPDEYYAQLVFNRTVPNISAEHEHAQNTQLPSPEHLKRQLDFIPSTRDPEFYNGLVTILQGEISRVVCWKCENLRGNLKALDAASAMLRRSVLGHYMEGVRRAILTLPPLPETRFDAQETAVITGAINKIMRVVFGQKILRFEPTPYTFKT